MMKFRTALVLAGVLIGTAGAQAATESKIEGTVEVSKDFASKVTPTSVLFIIAREPGVKSGPPVAVLRVPTPKFPQKFELGTKNMMMGGDFKGPYEITAKLSKTGEAMTSSGDLLGETDTKKAVSPGSKGVKVMLSKAAP
jgi:hypothetical protein